MRLIDADKLKVRKFQNDTMNPVKKGWNKAIYYVDSVIRNAPTIDAVEVVRCENCKHCMIADYYTSDNEKYVTMYHCKLYDNVLKNNDDYCNYGERKEDDD